MAARQPRAATGQAGTIELLPGRHFEFALLDLDGWEYIWVLYWFDRNDSPEKRSILQVHPRGDPARPLRGVFAIVFGVLASRAVLLIPAISSFLVPAYAPDVFFRAVAVGVVVAGDLGQRSR